MNGKVIQFCQIYRRNFFPSYMFRLLRNNVFGYFSLTENSYPISLAKHCVYFSASVSDASPGNRFIMWHLNTSWHHTDLDLDVWSFWRTKIKVYPQLADWRIKEALGRLLYFSLRHLRWSNSCFSCNFKHLMGSTHNLVRDAWKTINLHVFGLFDTTESKLTNSDRQT